MVQLFCRGILSETYSVLDSNILFFISKLPPIFSPQMYIRVQLSFSCERSKCKVFQHLVYALNVSMKMMENTFLDEKSVGQTAAGEEVPWLSSLSFVLSVFLIP